MGMKVKRFEDLEIWIVAISLAKDIYKLTKSSSFRKDWGLSSQIQRAVVSISANIVEGFERNNNNEFIRFLKIAKGSCGEVRNHLYIAREIGYISIEEFNSHHDKADELGKQIGGFIQYLVSKRKDGDFKKK